MKRMGVCRPPPDVSCRYVVSIDIVVGLGGHFLGSPVQPTTPCDAEPSLTVTQVRCDHLCVQSGLLVLAHKRLPGVEQPPSNSSIW